MPAWTAWIWRGAIDRVYAATRALPTIGRRSAVAPLEEPHWSGERRDRGAEPRVSKHGPQHVNPAKRLERGHPKR
jgi:hypothetical protein